MLVPCENYFCSVSVKRWNRIHQREVFLDMLDAVNIYFLSHISSVDALETSGNTFVRHTNIIIVIFLCKLSGLFLKKSWQPNPWVTVWSSWVRPNAFQGTKLTKYCNYETRLTGISKSEYSILDIDLTLLLRKVSSTQPRKLLTHERPNETWRCNHVNERSWISIF